jgi:hypothetical protein
MPEPPEPSLAPPDSAEREPDPAEEFTGAQVYEPLREPKHKTTEAGW